jgi:hypothetical protein
MANCSFSLERALWTRWVYFNWDPISQLDIGSRFAISRLSPMSLAQRFVSFFDSGVAPRRNAVWYKKLSGSTEMFRVF